jgi:WD40 repeat protein
MTISTEAQPLSYNGNGVVTAFAITWRYLLKADVVATLRSAAGVETVQVLITNYTLTDADVEAGGTLTMLVAPASGTTLVITLEPPNTQSSSLPLGGPFPSSAVEDALDRLAQQINKIENITDRAMLVPKTDTQSGSNLALPIDSLRASKFSAWDATGKPIAAAGTSANLAPVSAFVDTLLDDSTADIFLTTLGMTSARLRAALGLTEVEVVYTDPGDFSDNALIRGIPQFPWSAPVKLANPASSPTSTGRGCAFSPNGEFLAVAHTTSPFVTIYQRMGTTFIKLANPIDLPASNGVSISWSPNGELLAIGHEVPPFITIYQRNGAIFTKFSNLPERPVSDGLGCAFSHNGEFLAVAHITTPRITIYQRSIATMLIKLANPATLPTGDGTGCAWSPNDEFLAVAHFLTPFITIYQRSGTTFTKLTNPATLPTGDGQGCAWSTNGEFLAVAHDVDPFITIYQRSGTTFTKLADPATVPTDANGCAFSPNGEFLAVAHDTTPFIMIYQRSGTTFTKLANPATLPTSFAQGCAFSPNGEFLVVAHTTSPFITIYQTASDLPAEAILTTRKKFRAGV